MRVNDLKSLMAFISVVEQGSFTKASEKLHLTRSAVSKMISKLEVQLGVVLFNRDTRHLALTEEGSIFYEHSQRAVQELLIAETLFESNNQNIQGMIRISMPVLFGQKFIVPILRDLADEHQNLNMVLSFNDRYIDLIEDNYDLVIRIGNLEDNSQLMVKKISEHAMWLCATPEYLKRYQVPESIKDLDNHQTIGYLKNGQLEKWIFQSSHHKTMKYLPKNKVQMDDIKSILDYVLMHGGIGWLPSWLIQEYIQSGQLIRLLTNYSSTNYPIQIVWKRSNFLPIRVRTTIDKIASSIQKDSVIK